MRTSHKLTQLFLSLTALVALAMASLAQAPTTGAIVPIANPLALPAAQVGIVNQIEVSDQKPGSVLVFPYYTSNLNTRTDTRITISNLATANLTVVGLPGGPGPNPVGAFQYTGSIIVHVFFIRGSDCQQSDQYICLTKGASISFLMSQQDPDTTGYVIAVAVDQNGLPVSWNALIGNAFVNNGTIQGNYGAEAFANTGPFGFLTTTANLQSASATLVFNGGVPLGVPGGFGNLPFVPPAAFPLGVAPAVALGYDQVPNQFAVEIQAPADAPGQTVVHAGLAGDISLGGALTGAAQVGTGLVWRGDEKQGSFVRFLVGVCQTFGVIRVDNPRVPGTLGVFLPKGSSAVLRYDTGPSVGLLLTPFQFTAALPSGVIPGTFGGIRTLHKTRVATTTSLIIPVFMPVC